MKFFARLLLPPMMILTCAIPCRGQEVVSVGFYNVENLFDTVPSLFYDDGDYTPGGRMRWNSDRYRTKLGNLAKVIDEMSLDVLGLAEVENETVVRDLVATLQTDYNYIHLTGGDSRGIDLALLYKGDKFIPEQQRLVGSGASREFLYIRGELSGQLVDIIICHMPSRLNRRRYRQQAVDALYRFAKTIHDRDDRARIIIMGDFNATPSDRIMRGRFDNGGKNPESVLFLSPLARTAALGHGTYAFNDKWMLLDNIFISKNIFACEGAVCCKECGIFIRPYMLAQDTRRRKGYPLRTFTSGEHTAGYSDHLPVYVILGTGDDEDAEADKK